MFVVLIILIILALVSFFLKRSKGEIGETEVALLLKRKLPKDYVVLNNITLPSNYQYYKTTQIDHIVFSTRGIFIIETKNYTGIITGFDRDEDWVKNVYGHKYPFRNPVKQNYAHLKALQSILGLKRQYFHTIVVFSDSATLSVHTENNVVYYSHLISTIRQYEDEVISSELIQRLINKVQQSAIKEKGTKKQHVKNVDSAVKERHKRIENGICPRCGGILVERNSKYGRFYGCSNYPNCKFTLNE